MLRSEMLTVDIQPGCHYFLSCKDNKLTTKSAVCLKALLPCKFCTLSGLINEQATPSLYMNHGGISRAYLG